MQNHSQLTSYKPSKRGHEVNFKTKKEMFSMNNNNFWRTDHIHTFRY